VAETTFEQAKRCPKCQTPGEDTKSYTPPKGSGLAPGTKVHVIYCRQEGCVWKNTPWMVQVNSDGSVPPPRDHRGEAKLYVGFEGHEQLARDIVQAAKLDAANQIIPGHELRRPRDI
jgi:hypothetical protein